jgi:hypothetical protein
MQIASAIACILSGLTTIILTYYKPPAYWNNASWRFFRPLIGDRSTLPKPVSFKQSINLPINHRSLHSFRYANFLLD